MAVDDLATCVARSSTAMVLTGWDIQVLVCHEGRMSTTYTISVSRNDRKGIHVFFVFSWKHFSTQRINSVDWCQGQDPASLDGVTKDPLGPVFFPSLPCWYCHGWLHRDLDYSDTCRRSTYLGRGHPCVGTDNKPNLFTNIFDLTPKQIVVNESLFDLNRGIGMVSIVQGFSLIISNRDYWNHFKILVACNIVCIECVNLYTVKSLI